MTLKEIRIELSKNVFNNFLYFMPQNVIENSPFKPTHFKNSKQNNFHLINSPNLEDTMVFEMVLTQVMPTKSSELEENLFILFEKEEKLNEKQFKLLLECYHQQILSLVNASKSLFNYSTEYKYLNPSKTVQGFLEIQHDNFFKHLTRLEKSFNMEIQNHSSALLYTQILRLLADLTESTVEDSTAEKIKHFQKSSLEPSLTPPSLEDFISHEKSDEIVDIIKESFTEEKGKKIRYIFEYLADKNLLDLSHGNRRKIFNTLKNTFNRDVGKYNSIWGYAVNKLDGDYISTEKRLDSILEAYLSNNSVPTQN